ncbi:MAG: hypothetical protein ACRDP7_27420, partial [Trebonia sp.]
EPAGSSGNVRVATEADLQAILTLDRAAYGADRARILTRLPDFAERIVVFEASEGIVGYASAWRTEAYLMIGPLIAPDGLAARRLIVELAADSPVAVRLDLNPDRSELPGWARAHGLEPTERTVMMTYGDLTRVACRKSSLPRFPSPWPNGLLDAGAVAAAVAGWPVARDRSWSRRAPRK